MKRAGQRGDDVTHDYLRRAGRDDRGLVPAQVMYVVVAQEKQRVFRTVKRRNPVTGATHPWLVPATGVIDQYYFYCVDEDFGPVCVKFSGYFPYAGRLILNGNKYAQGQAAKAGHRLRPAGQRLRRRRRRGRGPGDLRRAGCGHDRGAGRPAAAPAAAPVHRRRHRCRIHL